MKYINVELNKKTGVELGKNLAKLSKIHGSPVKASHLVRAAINDFNAEVEAGNTEMILTCLSDYLR